MKANGIDKIKDDGGDFLVLADYGAEGLHVISQHATAAEAIKSALTEGYESRAVVQLVDLEQHDSPCPRCADLFNIIKGGQWSDCPQCGLFPPVDEDGCCATCGADAMVYASRGDYPCCRGAEKDAPTGDNMDEKNTLSTKFAEPRDKSHMVAKFPDDAPTGDSGEGGHEDSEGVCHDGAVILRDGQRMRIEDIISELQDCALLRHEVERLQIENSSLRAKGGREQHGDGGRQ